VAALTAQELLPVSSDSGVRLFGSDETILEAQENRKDLPCTVTPAKPSLGFDMKFHAGYDIAVPLKELAGDENLLTVVFRVTPNDHPDQPVYFSQRINVPKIDEEARGEANLNGVFDVGEGKYKVSWLMRDRAERVCSFSWDAEASLPPKDREMALDIKADGIQASDPEPFKEEPPVTRRQDGAALNIKVLINFAPQEWASAALQPLDTHALVSILRSIARDERIGKFSIVAFNMQEQRVIYRQNQAAQIDFPALGDALKTLNLGTVNLKQLAQKGSDVDFLGNLITGEISKDAEKPDAVIIAGPKVKIDQSIPQDMLRSIGDVNFPIFYMNYNLNPQDNPWRDAIGNAVRALKGTEFTITRPRDLFFAWTEIMGRIVKSKEGRTLAGNSSPR
jgi:hypothetical protein